ncbi:MAG: hypothetical protein FJ272_18935, partial [Planctomycetes bacterium]|nr:hypothetical protein [Planctomycetota bacterium]
MGILCCCGVLWAFLDVAPGAESLRLDFSRPLPESAATTAPAAAAGEGIRLLIERPFARPGDRWIEAGVQWEPARVEIGKARLQARLFELGKAQPVEEASVAPKQHAGTLWVDLRRRGLREARVCVELFEGTERKGVAEAFLSARECPTPLQAGQRIPVNLDLPPGCDGVKSWPVTFGVPFAPGALWDVTGLRLVDRQGREIPCQTEVTARWAVDGAIQWVRMDALVSSQDGCLVEVAASGPGSSLVPSVRVAEEAGKVTVATGVARYVVGKGASPIQEVWLGKSLVASSAGTRGLYVLDQTARLASASAEGETMEIEATGPVAACVRFEGFYRTAQDEPLA